MTDVITINNQCVAAIVGAAHDQMYMRIAGVPVIDCDPIQPRSEVMLHLLNEVTRKGAKVRHLGGVFRTDDETEMMPVVAGTLGKGAEIGVVRNGVEQPGPGAVFGDPLSPEIREVRANRIEGAESLPDDAGFYDHPARMTTV